MFGKKPKIVEIALTSDKLLAQEIAIGVIKKVFHNPTIQFMVIKENKETGQFNVEVLFLPTSYTDSKHSLQVLISFWLPVPSESEALRFPKVTLRPKNFCFESFDNTNGAIRFIPLEQGYELDKVSEALLEEFFDRVKHIQRAVA